MTVTQPKTMLAFHNDPKIKELYLARVRAHRKADELVHGVYWQNGKGCAVGCTIHSSDHYAYESELGIPAQLAQLEDSIFEQLPNGDAQAWPEQFLSAIKVGANLSLVWPKFAIWLLTNKKYGWPEDKHCIAVAALYRDVVAGKDVSPQKFADAAGAATYIARVATCAAGAVAWDAAHAAGAAAWAARYAAGGATWEQATKLLELLQEAEVRK